VAVLDGVKGEVTVVAPAWVAGGLSARAAYAQAAERVMDALRDLDRAPSAARDLGETAPVGEAQSNFTHAATRPPWRRPRTTSARATSSRWCPASAGRSGSCCRPSRCIARFGAPTRRPSCSSSTSAASRSIGASPEILVRLRDGEVTVRPIAGTRKRGATPEEDKALEADLLADPKERAEHLMLLDLGRNDVGRVAKVGTVRPTETFIIERYSHVMHIVSNVVGEIGAGEDALSALLAGLPAGTVSRARPRSGRWRSSTSWNRKSAASMAAAWAISPPMARWTSASRCARRS
jgi:anthranilate synthase component 1